MKKAAFKIVAILVAAGLAAGAFSGTAAYAAAVKAGASCPSVGATKTVAARKFTCVKTGKKLVWSKGVAVKAKPSKSPDLIAPISLDNLDVNLVRKQAYAAVFAGIQASNSYSPAITFVIGPSLTKARVDSEKAGLLRASSFWSDIYQPKQVFIGYVTEMDVDWVDKAYCDQANYCPNGNKVIFSETLKRERLFCNSAMATRTNDKLPFFHQCLGTGSDEIVNKQTGPHEYTHLAQAEVSGNFNGVPNWWTEGSAHYFGSALGVFDGKTPPRNLDLLMREPAKNWLNQDLCLVGWMTPEVIEKCFKYTHLEPSQPAAGQRWVIAHVSYYPGALATEVLLALYGLEKVKLFMTDMKTKGFEAAFTANFGITSDVFYAKVSRYVVAMYKAGR